MVEINKSKELYQANVKEQVGLIDLLRKFPDLARGLTLEILLNKCNFIKPRYYTIASSAEMYPNELHIGISLTEDKLPSGKVKVGQTSAFLDRIHKKSAGPCTVRLFTKESNFVMTKDPTVPIAMVGAGTGVVPFIGFLQTRSLLQKEGQPIGEAHLFFGCKYKDVDFIYRDEMAGAVDQKVISDLHLAFSRQDPNKKHYVQHLIQEQS